MKALRAVVWSGFEFVVVVLICAGLAVGAVAAVCAPIALVCYTVFKTVELFTKQ